MKLETNRLILQTLDLELMDAAAKQDPAAVEALGYRSNGEWPGPDFLEALPYFRQLYVQNGGTRGYDSWVIVTKERNEIVGGVGFLGSPGPDGSIEIGFATNPSHQRKGYGFEAAERLIEWASGQKEVLRITARCELGNSASRGVLEKLGFEADHKDDELIYWSYRGTAQ